MDIRQSQFSGAIVLSPVGRIDHATSEDFRKQLEVIVGSAAGEALIFDLTGVEYISSAGLRCFMLASKQAKTQGSPMVVAGLQPVVKEIFEISRFTLVFEMFPTVRDAIAEVAPGALSAYDGR